MSNVSGKKEGLILSSVTGTANSAINRAACKNPFLLLPEKGYTLTSPHTHPKKEGSKQFCKQLCLGMSDLDTLFWLRSPFT